jgi:peptidoglycan/xylan/chitin deacetylase (PgdA/CDA1 family)
VTTDETPRGAAALPPTGFAQQQAATLYRRASAARRRMGRPAGWSGLRILCYHRICTARDVLAVPPDLFRRQLEYALGTGARPARLADVVAAPVLPDTGRMFCVTFDDGYQDTLDRALPVLQALSMPATVFLATAITSGTAQLTWYREPPRMLDWKGVHELVADGLVDAGAHSRTHPALPRLDEASARAEISGSRAEIGDMLGRLPTTFAYPAGLYGPREARLCAEAGYSASLTVHGGISDGRSDRQALARTVVYGGEPLSTFAARFDGCFDAPSRMRTLVLARRSRGVAISGADVHSP